MASRTINGGTQFPDGTSVAAYARSQWPVESLSGAPSGSAADTQTVTGGSLTFNNLAADTDYVAYASVGGQDRYRRFSTRESPLQSAGSSSTLAKLRKGKTLANIGNGPYWLKVLASPTGDRLYVLFTNDHKVHIYGLTDPANPTLLGAITSGLGNSPAYIDAFGTDVFVTDQTDLTLKTFNCTDPAAPTLTSTFAYSSGGTGGGRCAVDDTGNKVFIGGPESGVNINKAVLVDVTNRAAPATLGTITVGATHRGVSYLGNSRWALSSRDDAKVPIINASTPAAPVVESTITTTHGNTTTPNAYDATTQVLYVGQYGVGFLESWDVSNPANPVFKGFVATDIGSEQIALIPGSRALIALRATAKLVLVDTSNPAALSVLATYVPGGTTTPGVAYRSGNAYMTAAGDTANGKVYTVAVEPTIDAAVDAVQKQFDALVVTNNVFGDGSDGPVHLDGTATFPWATKVGSVYTMTRDVHATSFAQDAGVTLKPAGYAIFLTGAGTSAGTISNDGNAGTNAGVAGGQTPNGRYSGGQAGGAGNTAGGAAGTAAGGGIGAGTAGAGGAGASGGGGASGSGSGGNAFMLRVPHVALTGVCQVGGSVRAVAGGGGGGGGGGDTTNKGGGGGSGGGTVAIFAKGGFVNTGTISAVGGAGGAGQGGNSGGGGGGGGGVIVVYTTAGWTPGTTAVTGGAGGAGVGTGVAGGNGAGGTVLNVIVQ